MRRQLATRHKSLLTVIGLALLAAMACGASSVKSESKGKHSGPVNPSTYDPQLSIAPLVKQVAPAVVNIKTSSTMRLPGGFGPDRLFEWFFGPRGGHQGPFGVPRDKEIQRRSVGSGFIVDAAGLVVTNHHVVDGADEVEVQLADERQFIAEVIGSDERTDVALLQLHDAKNLPTAKWGDSEDLDVGDWVVAIGNPFGLDHTVTSGIVSAKERVIGAGPYDAFIQTDASINPGNSGGPLFNLYGEVVGIATAIAPQGQGIGFAIPSNLALGVIEELRGTGKVVRGWLGIAFQPLTEDLARAFGLDHKRGAVVANVNSGSPAEKGGMKAGDVIVEVGRKPLKNGRQLPSLVAALDPGTKVKFTVIRKGKRRKLEIEMGEMPEDHSSASLPSPSTDEPHSESADIGLKVTDLNENLQRRLGAKDLEHGVVVTRIDSGSVAARVLRKGDIITEVNRDRVRDVKEFERRIAELNPGDDVLLLVFRHGSWEFVVFRL